MSAERSDQVADRKDLLRQDDHMGAMERLAMTVEHVARPFPSVMRVTARIAPRDPAAWRRPNLAIRLEVETPPSGRPVSRVYTVRAFDEPRSLIEVDFVMHADDSPAMRWLAAARPGTVCHLTGPRPHYLPSHAAGRRVALFADETAIPALYAILRGWPEGAEGALHVETADAAAFDELPAVPGVARHLLLRGAGEAAGTTGRLVEAARGLAAAGGWTAWAAGERQEARAIRALFSEQGVAKEDVRSFGYWRRGVSSSEIDRQRLKHYEALREQGDGLRQFEDLDLPV